MIEDCSVTNGMQRAARRMTEQPMKLIGIILAKHQEAILEVCKEQQEKIEALNQRALNAEAEVAQMKIDMGEGGRRLVMENMELTKQRDIAVAALKEIKGFQGNAYYVAFNALSQIEGEDRELS